MTQYEDYLSKELVAARHALRVDGERINQLQGLCARAADALESYLRQPSKMAPRFRLTDDLDLLDKLRKAAR